MKQRPIIFSVESVRAILAGRKTQTRRVVKPQPDRIIDGKPWWNIGGFAGGPRCPFGMPGDRLWVREKWCCNGIGKGDVPRICFAAEPNPPCAVRWRSPLHLPRRFARLILEISDVRIEPLHAISEADAVAEGMERLRSGRGYYHSLAGKGVVQHGEFFATATDAFAELWNSLNTARGFPWDANPWVWAVTFRVAEPENIAP